MPGLDPGIYVFFSDLFKDVDGRDKPGHDGEAFAGRRIASGTRSIYSAASAYSLTGGQEQTRLRSP